MRRIYLHGQELCPGKLETDLHILASPPSWIRSTISFIFVVEDSVKSERDKAWDTIHQVFPDIENQIEIVHYPVTTPEMAAVSIDGYIPDVWTPVRTRTSSGRTRWKQYRNTRYRSKHRHSRN